jgi:GT2 family glycosyltransferase
VTPPLDDTLSRCRERLAQLKQSPETAELAALLDELAANLQRLESELHAAARNQSLLEQRLERIENSALFRTLRGVGGRSRDLRRKLGQAILHSPLHPLYARIAGPGDADPAYNAWITAREQQLPSRDAHRQQSAQWSYQPLVSVVIPVYNSNPEWLEQAVQSVCAQSYTHLQLCLSFDGPINAHEQALVDRLAQSDNRIVAVALPRHGGISAALNNAAQAVTGEYVAFLDHDDLLSPYALHYVVEALQNGRADLLYSDEDRINSAGNRVRPNFKPGWSPDLLTSCMYMGHLLVVSRERLDEAGWFRSEYDGAQDYDLALRLTDSPPRVVHVEQVLYHWRMHTESTSSAAAAKPYAHEAGRKALADALARRDRNAVVADGPFAHTYAARPVAFQPDVAVVICSRNAALLDKCLTSVFETAAGAQPEVVVVHHNTGLEDAAMKAVLDRFGCRVITYTREFNFAEMNNLGAAQTAREFLLFLNDDVAASEPGWMQQMLHHLTRAQVGAVGARLLYPAGSIQHAGIVLGIGEATGHAGRHQFRNDLWPWLDLTRNVTAVTGACLGIRRAVFEEIGGFDVNFSVNYNDVDLCLRLRQAGYEIVYEGAAVLQHAECSTRASGTRTAERARFYNRWGHLLRCPDPYYSPFLTSSDEEIKLAEPGIAL